MDITPQLQNKITEYHEFYNKEHEDFVKTLPLNLQRELQHEKMMKVIEKISFLQNFSKKTQEKIAFLLEEIILPEASIVFQKNEEDNSCFLIKKGYLTVLLDDCHGIFLREENEAFGEYELITGSYRKYGVSTISACFLLKLKRKDFLEVLMTNNEDYYRFCQMRDSISLYRDFTCLNTICKACNDLKHCEFACPELNYSLRFDRNQLIRQNEQQEERTNFHRKNTKKEVFL